MQTAELQVLKDIPGYKVILKAVIKGQIQQLVEQLANQTGEESVILTASVSDGSLSHLGSESGKVFLEGHDDIKSQFLGFCLKRYQQQSQPQSEELVLSQIYPGSSMTTQSASVPRAGPGRKQRFPPGHLPHARDHLVPTQFPSPQYNTDSHSVHPVSLTRAPQSNAHRNSNRAGPQSMKRRSKENRVSSPHVNQDNNSMKLPLISEPDSKVIKIEASGEEFNPQTNFLPENSQALSDSVKDNSTVSSHNNVQPQEFDSQNEVLAEKSNMSASHLTQNINDTTDAEGFGSGSNQSETMNEDHSGADLSYAVKVEPISESELELEITGVEPGQTSSFDSSWTLDASAGSGFGEPVGQTRRASTGSDRQQNTGIKTGVKSEVEGFPELEKKPQFYCCKLCSYQSKWAANLRRHLRTNHTTKQPSPETTVKQFICDTCGKQYKRRYSLSMHIKIKHSHKYRFVCNRCGKGFVQLWHYRGHMARHRPELKCKCNVCGKSFTYESNLVTHQKRCSMSAIKLDETEFACKECNQSFKSKKNLTDHTRGQHGHQRLACEICGKTFKWRSSLSYHKLHVSHQ